MKTLKLYILSSILTLTIMQSAFSQERSPHIDIEVEPVAYILNGAGITVSYQPADIRYSLEVFGLEVPESLHGNEGFDADVLGVEFHAEYFFTEASPAGFFAGPEVGISNLTVTHRESGISEDHLQFSAGLRAGYRWYTGLGDLYLSPQGGVVFTLNPKDFEIQNEVYESGFLTPFVTVGIGWSFSI